MVAVVGGMDAEAPGLRLGGLLGSDELGQDEGASLLIALCRDVPFLEFFIELAQGIFQVAVGARHFCCAS